MTALEQLNAYLQSLERRLRVLAISRGAALVAASALLLTLVFAFIGNAFAFTSRVVWPLRVLLYLSVAAAISFALVRPLLRLTRRWVARRAEQSIPGFQERLLTVSEKGDPANPFTELLAEDALSIARQHDPEELAPRTWILGSIGSAAVAAAVLVWMILAAPGYLGYGASLLWAGAPRTGIGPLYDIAVQPGNKSVRRKTDQLVSAKLLGFSSASATLHAKYKNSLKWEQAPMQSQRDGNGFEFLFAGLPDSVEYYIEAGRSTSPHFTLTAKDIAGVQRLRVVVHPPSWLGLKEVVDDPGGDVRTVEGAQADISVLTDRPLDQGVLVMEDGSRVELKHADGNWLKASLNISKDGSYHVAAIDGGETIRISEDYFIEAKKDEPPSIKIAQNDVHASPIEEVPISVEASDDFGLQDVELHYSVNGGKDEVLPLLKSKGGKETSGKATIALENYNLKPGDLVSLYASAKDARQTSRTDIVFVKVDPFDLTFRQSQQMGGGGGGSADDSAKISEKQTEVIVATWNESKNGIKDSKSAGQDALFISDVETKIGEQAKTLSERMRSRELSESSIQFADFSKEMDKAADETKKASELLRKNKFEDALPPEQRALQSFLRAEAMFRDIQVAFNRMGGGGGQGGSAGRDLERMLDLELDTEKNQYETGESASSSQSEKQKAVDEMAQRLKMLAQRQQQLARQRQPEQAFQQRYEQEMLRREAEELQRQLEQQLQQNSLNRQGSQQGSQQQRAGQQGQQGQQGLSGQSGQQGGSQSASARGQRQQGGQAGGSQSAQQTVRQAMDALKQAQDEMRKAVTEHDPAAMQRAAAALNKAQDLMAGLERKQAGDSINDLAQQAEALAEHQKDFVNRMKQEFPGPAYPGMTPFSDTPRRRFAYEPTQRPTNPTTQALATEKDKMAEQLQQLEQQIRDRAQALAGGQPDATSKMRSALSEVEQKDLTLHMKKNADWIRKGWGQQVAPDEENMAQSLDDMKRELEQAQAMLKDGSQGGGKPGSGDSKSAQALADIQRLRQQLEQQAQAGSQGRAKSGQPGNQPGQGNSPQDMERAANSGQEQEGMSPGRPQRGSGVGGGSLALPGQPGDPTMARGGDFDPDAIRDSLRQLDGVRQRFGDRSDPNWKDIGSVIRELEQINMAQPGLLAARLNQELLPALERLEIEVKRQADQEGNAARSAKPENAPEGYRDAVAEYFRKLSH
jgi:hypothetical protein